MIRKIVAKRSPKDEIVVIRKIVAKIVVIRKSYISINNNYFPI